jgi:hypothetical protein
VNVRRLALAVALSLVPFAAAAADLPVSYLVEEKPLKAAVAGTPLTFELYSDNACTTLVQSVPVVVENVSLLTKLKQMTPKNDTKLPNTVELRTTLAGVAPLVPPAVALYLKVSGTGVSPVAGPCQAQAASNAGRPVVVDQAGAVVGLLDFGPDPTVGYAGHHVLVFSGTSVGSVLLLDDASPVNPCGPSYIYAYPLPPLFYTTGDCTGVPYLRATYGSSAIGNTAYIPGGAATSMTHNSRRDVSVGGCSCNPDVQTRDLFPAIAVDMSGFTPPFRIELR